VPHRQIRTRTFLAPTEAPLSVIPAVASRHAGVFSGGWRFARVDESVQQQPLRSAGREFAWGFGVHATHELEFELPRQARAFRTLAALDQAASSGGCVRCRVLRGQAPLWNGPLVIGAERVFDSGRLPLTPGRDRLRLVVDATPADAPPGADPFDIRDVFNWLEPTVELDPQALRQTLEPLHYLAQPLLAGWTADAVDAANWRPINQFDVSNPGTPCFRPLMELRGAVKLSRRIEVEPGRTAAALRFGRPAGAGGHAQFEVWLDGRRVLRESLPAFSDNAEPLTVLASLQDYAGRSVDVTIRLDPRGQRTVVDWRGLTLERVEKSE
jgi:hypothetical protein